MNKKLTQQQAMYDRIERHGQYLNIIFKTQYEPIALCKKLRIIEAKQDKANCDYCNGDITGAQHELITERTRNAAINLLGTNGPDIYINDDPRGFALKIQPKDAQALDLPRDLGGYGLLAPDLTNP